MNKGLILWDIDGTLLRRVSKESNSIHFEALYGNKNYFVDGTELTGLTDWEVLNFYEKNTENLKMAFDELDKIQETQSLEEFVPIAGVNNELFLEIGSNWINGVLTGNSFRRANFKIKAIGLLESFNLEYFFVCEEGETRPDILKRALTSIGNEFNEIVIVGDTVNDIKTAKLFGLPVVSIATGKFKLTELLKFHPDLAISNLLDEKLQFQNFLSSRAM